MTLPAAPPARTLDELPGPSGIPLLGNLLQLDPPRLHQTLERWVAEYGPLYHLRLGRQQVLVVADGQPIFAVLRDRPGTFRRLGNFAPIFDEMGIAGVFSAEGDAWRRQRRIVMQAFHPGHLRAFFPTLAGITERLRARWDRAAAAGESIDAPADLMRYTVDVTTALAFGHDMRTLDGNDDVIQRHLDRIFPAIARRIIAAVPYWRFVKLPADRELDRALAAVHAAVTDFIARARQRLAADPAAAPRNLLEALILARDEDGSAFTDAEISGNVFTMLLGGEDTTANTIAWALHYLCERPDVQAALAAEVDRVYPQPGELAELALLDRLHYLEAVANETMRLKPVAPLIFLEANVDTTVAGVAVPKGTAVFIVSRAAAIAPAAFPDPLAFRPERWLSDGGAPQPAAALADAQRAFLPFGAGPRFCPGRGLALVEIKHVLATIARHYTISRAEPGRPVEERFNFVMIPVGLKIRLTPRAAALTPG
jgi:cytochrome P450